MSGSMTGSHVGATRNNYSLMRETVGRVIGEKFSWVLLYEKKYLASKRRNKLLQTLDSQSSWE